MELAEELISTITQYEEALQDVELLLLTAPNDCEALQMREELRACVLEAKSALYSLEGATTSPLHEPTTQQEHTVKSGDWGPVCQIRQSLLPPEDHQSHPNGLDKPCVNDRFAAETTSSGMAYGGGLLPGAELICPGTKNSDDRTPGDLVHVEGPTGGQYPGAEMTIPRVGLGTPCSAGEMGIRQQANATYHSAAKTAIPRRADGTAQSMAEVAIPQRANGSAQYMAEVAIPQRANGSAQSMAEVAIPWRADGTAHSAAEMMAAELASADSRPLVDPMMEPLEEHTVEPLVEHMAASRPDASNFHGADPGNRGGACGNDDSTADVGAAVTAPAGVAHHARSKEDIADPPSGSGGGFCDERRGFDGSGQRSGRSEGFGREPGHPGRSAERGGERPQTNFCDGARPKTQLAQKNRLVHPKNKYADRTPDFAALAAKDDELRPYVKILPGGRGSIDFTDYNACRQLTRALLLHDYGIRWWLPEGHLVPPVTNRANYIHWLQDLATLLPGGQEISVLDVGCGASLIYPLLGAAITGWRFVGVDITPQACHWAGHNASMNPHLQGLIEVRRVEPPTGALPLAEGVLLPAVREGERFAFSMCNPPFFESLEEAGRNPGTAYAGTAEEMVCPGGEAAFVSQMLRDSVLMQERICWYTTMVGKKATLRTLRQAVQRAGATAVRTTELAQGRTSRWAVAWSYTVRGLSQDALLRPGGTLPAPAIRHTPRRTFTIGVRRKPHGGVDLLGEIATWFRQQTDVLDCQVDKSCFTLEAKVCPSNPSLGLEAWKIGGNVGGAVEGALYKKRKRNQGGEGVPEALPEAMPAGLRAGACMPRGGMANFQDSEEVTGDVHHVTGDVHLNKGENRPSPAADVLYLVRVAVLQDSPGSFVVRGSIPASGPLVAATHFSALAANLQVQIGRMQL
eukprot:jgi/Botrbrau1/2154/Bobra.0093s0055.2